jgi:hypothetical protein
MFGTPRRVTVSHDRRARSSISVERAENPSLRKEPKSTGDSLSLPGTFSFVSCFFFNPSQCTYVSHDAVRQGLLKVLAGI